MFECPVCQSMMEEQASLVTECCEAEVENDEVAECPACGMDAPEIIEGPTRLVCENCGYSE